MASSANIAGLSEAEVLMVLFKHASPGRNSTKASLSVENAEALLKDGSYVFDYVDGRAIKVVFNDSGTIDTTQYDNANAYEGFAQEVLECYRLAFT